MRLSPDPGVLAHLTNGVLPKTPFWDELQQKECQSVNEFYRKARKYMKLENSKEALRKANGVATYKKNNPGTVQMVAKDKTRNKEK